MTVLAASGEIDLQSSPELQRALRELIRAKCPALVIDLAGIAYMDSSGLATLIEYFQGARGFGGKLALCGLSPRIKNLFEVARLDQIFTIHGDESAAVASLGGAGV